MTKLAFDIVFELQVKNHRISPKLPFKISMKDSAVSFTGGKACVCHCQREMWPAPSAPTIFLIFEQLQRDFDFI